MKRRAQSGFVAFSLRERERARLSRVALNLGYTQLGTLAAELFRIGLEQLEGSYVPVTTFERLGRLRLSFRATKPVPLEGVE